MPELCADCGATFASPAALVRRMSEAHSGGGFTASLSMNPEAGRPGLVRALCRENASVTGSHLPGTTRARTTGPTAPRAGPPNTSRPTRSVLQRGRFPGVNQTLLPTDYWSRIRRSVGTGRLSTAPGSDRGFGLGAPERGPPVGRFVPSPLNLQGEKGVLDGGCEVRMDERRCGFRRPRPF